MNNTIKFCYKIFCNLTEIKIEDNYITFKYAKESLLAFGIGSGNNTRETRFLTKYLVL